MEQHLPGGLVNAVVRIGDTVRRPSSPNATFVHALLGHFEQHGWDGAPRHLRCPQPPVLMSNGGTHRRPPV